MLEFRIDADLLSAKLKSISYIINGIDSKSLLARLKIEVKDNEAIFSLSGSTDRAILRIPCQSIRQGVCYIVASSLIAILQTLTGEITLQLVDEQLLVKQPDLEIKLSIIEDYSGLFNGIEINQQFNNVGSIDINTLGRAANLTTPFVNIDSNNSTKGVCLKFDNKTFKAMSCNGPILAFANFNEQMEGSTEHVVLRPETLNALCKIFAGEIVNIHISNAAIKVVGNSGELYAAQLNGSYPPLERVIENDYTYSCNIKSKDIEHCLKCITALNYNKKYDKRLNLTLTTDNIELRVSNSFYKKITNIKNTIAKSQSLDLCINYELLQNALRALNSDELQINITPTNKTHIICNNNLIIIAPQIG